MITNTTVTDINRHNINNNDRESLCACILNSTKGIFTISGRFGITQMRSFVRCLFFFFLELK